MAYDEKLADKIREVMKRRRGITEKKMFGGLTFLANGNMACGVVGAELMVRVGKDAYEDALKKPGARPMDFTGKPLAGMVYVGKKGITRSASLKGWVERGLSHARSLPPK